MESSSFASLLTCAYIGRKRRRQHSNEENIAPSEDGISPTAVPVYSSLAVIDAEIKRVTNFLADLSQQREELLCVGKYTG